MRRLELLPSSPEYPTASELHRAAECVAPWALSLPEAEEAPGEWAEFGHYQHALAADLVNYLQHVPNVGLYDVSIAKHLQEAIDADRSLAKCIVWPDNVRVTVRAELGIKWRPGFPDDEAKLVQREPGERLRGWFSGTVDLAYVRADGVLVVVDWKFGPREHINGEPAQDSCQGFFLALALCTALEIRGSSAGVVVARFERRMVREDGIEVDGHDITQGELDSWAKMLAGLARRIDSAEGASPKLSAACGKCKAKAACPAWDALEAAIFGEVAGESWRCLLEAPKSPADIRARYHAAEAAEAAAGRWKDEARAYLMMHPDGVEIGLGLKLKAGEKGARSVVQTAEAMALIESVAGPNAIEVRRKSSLGMIEEAIKKPLRDAKNRAEAMPEETVQQRKARAEALADANSELRHARKAVNDVIVRLTEGGAILEKGARWGVSVVRSDGSETVWMKGESDGDSQ